MPDNIVDGEKSTPLLRSFQSHEIVAIPFEGELYVILAQLERAWGYARFALSKQLTRWETKGLVREGTHFRKLTNGTLAAFKTVAGMLFAKCEVDPKASQVLVITQRGLYRLLTLIPDKAIAIAFQDWLESEVLPAINRTGSYTAGKGLPSATSAAPQIEGPTAPPPPPPPPPPPRRRPGRPSRALLLPDHQQAEPSLSVVLMVDPRERTLADLDEGRLTGPPSMLGFRTFTVHDHLIGRARMALRDVYGPVWDRFMHQLVDELARIAGRPVPTFAGAPEATDWERSHLVLGRALRLLDHMEDGQLARVIPMIAARAQQARLIEWVGLTGALRPLGLTL